MTTRVKGLKISQVPELTELTGEEMIPYQYKCTNGKISTSTLAEYVADNYGGGSGNGGASSAEVEQLKLDVDALDSRIDTLNSKVNTKQDLLRSGENIKTINGTSILGSGNIQISGGSAIPDNLQQITYANLKANADAGTLVPGTKYAITDYSCIYIQPETNIEMEVPAPDFKYIVCTAISNKDLSYDVDIVRSDDKEVKIIAAKYSIDPEFCEWTRGMVLKQPKGVIFYLEDSNCNKLPYDFKHVKFRRWAIKDITANTTVDTGSNTNTSPFRCCVTDTTRKISDERKFIGAGDPDELNYVKSIFNGTWRLGGQSTPAHNYPMSYNSGAGVAVNTYHEDYIKQVLKPYQDTTNPNDKYLAWQTDMFAANGLSAVGSVHSSANWLAGMSNVEVDANDFMDRYTFDYEGQDLSDYMFDKNGQRRAVVCGNSFNENTNSMNGTAQWLPNLVFAVSKNCLPALDGNNTSTMLADNVFPYATRWCTFLLRAFHNSFSNKYCQVGHNDFGYMFRSNLCLVTAQFLYNKFGRFDFNYLNGLFSRVHVPGLGLANVMISMMQDSEFRTSTSNLFFGTHYYIKEQADTNFKSHKDGESWYNVYSNDWFGSNILAPMQYTHISPHMNANTFTSVFNKGINFQSAISLNVFGSLKWGVEIGYTSLQGVYVKSLQQCTVPASCAVPNLTKGANGINKINSTNRFIIPNLVCTDMELARASLLTLANDVADMTGYPTNCNRCKLYLNNSGVFELVSGIMSPYAESSVSLLSEDTANELARKILDGAYPTDDSGTELPIELD